MVPPATLDAPMIPHASTAMDRERFVTILHVCARLYSRPNVETIVVTDDTNENYLILDQGWNGFKRIHQTWVHVQIKAGKFWIHADRTQDGIAVDLLAAGVPHDRIVLAFQHPDRRKYGTFAPE